MTEWKKARIVRIALDGPEFAYFQVEGEAQEMRKMTKDLKQQFRINPEPGLELEVTLRMDKQKPKIDQCRRPLNPAPAPQMASTAKPHGQHSATRPAQGSHHGRTSGIAQHTPYTFLPIDLSRMVKDTPVWHDGSTEEQTYSGEILCSMTALTPLLVGNQRFFVKDVIRSVLPKDTNPKMNKGILEPLRLTDGKVVLPGTSIKGMIRYHLAILLNAPIERTSRRPPMARMASGNSDSRLNGIHLLFGCVADNKVRQPLDKLAGRIAINHAISEANPKFINKDRDFWVFLKVLGQPNIRAAERHLNNIRPQSDSSNSRLEGRKWYRHQPPVSTNNTCFQASESRVKEGNQATLARYVSAPGSVFRFTVRFARLRAWELGSLLLAINPHRARKELKAEDYALKIGYGRPLGLGSVCIAIDDLRMEGISVPNRDPRIDSLIDASKARLSQSTIDAWLRVLRYEGGLLSYSTRTGTR